MIDWNTWNIQHEKSKSNDAGLYLLDIRGIIHLKLDQGHEIKEVRWVIPMGPEKNVGEVLKRFQVSLK